MESFETTCVLWHPEHRDAAVGGTLRYRPDSGLSADLIGSLDPDQPIASVFELPTDEELAALGAGGGEVVNRDPGPLVPLLFGVVQARPITLLNVHRSEGATALPGHAHDVLTPEVLIRGRHLVDGFDTPVRSLAVAFDVLGAWYDTALRGANTPGQLTRDERERLTLDWTMPTPPQATLPSGDTVLLSADVDRHNGLREFHLRLDPTYLVRFAEPRSLRDALDMVTPLRWLTSLVTRRPARLIRLRCVGTDDPREEFDVIYRSTEPRGETGTVHPYAMALTLPELDFSTALPRWMHLTEWLRTPMALFFANWFSPGIYSENRVVNAAGAAESLGALVLPNERTELSERPHAVEQFIAAFPPDEQRLLRQRLKHINDPSLRDRLRSLATGADEAFTLVVAKHGPWVDAVVTTRNDIAHGNRLPGAGPYLRALAETVEHLIEVHLLMQLGLTSGQVADALRDTPRTRWIAELAERYLHAH